MAQWIPRPQGDAIPETMTTAVRELRTLLERESGKPAPQHGFDPSAPTVFLGAGSPWSRSDSYAGTLHGPAVCERLPQFIGKVGVYPFWYVPFRHDRFRYRQLRQLKRRFPTLQVVDFSSNPAVV